MELLENLDPLLRTFWYVAIPTSLIFILQTIMTFAGAHHSDGMDAAFDTHSDGHDGDGFHIFSFKNLINFLLGFSWTGISFYGLVGNGIGLILLALAVGVFFVWVFFFIIKQLQRLAEDNSFQLEDTLGNEVEVYLKIPAKGNGAGKVLASARGSMHELEAISDSAEIPSNAKARVVGVEGSILVVTPI